jgi:hypothetical protein
MPDTIIVELQQMFSISGANSLILLIMNSLMTQWDLKQEDIASRLVCFSANGVYTFQGLKFGVTI